MNITGVQLLAQYERGRRIAGPLIERINAEFGFPPFLLYAVYSRETNMDPYYLDHPGDGGHGHGWPQIDDRSHKIPADWATNYEWMFRKGAEILRAGINRCGSLEGGLNAYNSGRCEARFTTGKDYGPDVLARRAWLEANVAGSGGIVVAKLENLHPVFAERVANACLARGTTVFSGARSTERQRQLYNDYLAGRGNPANPPGTSWHEYGDGIPGGRYAMAVDFALPYPHGAPGLIFPIKGEPWHAQPSEIPESARVAGAESRMPAVPLPQGDLAMLTFRYIFDGQDWVFDGPSKLFFQLNDPRQITEVLDPLGVKALGQVSDTTHNRYRDIASAAGFSG